MNETTILLSPSPGNPTVKPDFLATVEPAIPRQLPFTLPFEFVLDGYTREPWSSGKETQQQNQSSGSGSDEWQSCYLVSTDGRNRLPGFTKFLRDRKKAAVAKFEATEALSSSTGRPSGKSMLVVPFDPPPIPDDQLPQGVDKSQVIFVKYLRDENILKRGDENAKRKLQQQKMLQQQKLMQQRQQQMMQQKKAQQQQLQSQKPRAAAAPPRKSGGGGLLGGLLGAQRRTENHLTMVRASKPSNDANFDPNAGVAGCINGFRTKISTELEKFKSDPTTFTTKISVDLNTLIKSVPTEDRDKCTMDVFKFTVYEQVEEVGMDKWVAAKEPSEFMDECVIAIYKEGHCPAEVLEDLNKGELPDEIKGQTKHLMEAQSKAIQRKGKVNESDILRQSNAEAGGDHDFSALNTNKRDRRTLEQIQEDMKGEDAKRGRYD